MFLRKYQPSDCRKIIDLFYNTVHLINSRDYTAEQVDAWAPPEADEKSWNLSLQEHSTLVAVEDGRIVGFGDMDSTGCLDRLFVHASRQGQGIATKICDRLEESCRGAVTTHASITAKPFFENRGYRVVKRQTVERNGVPLTNFVMVKEQKRP